jgi:hypothetical protein
MAEESKMKLPVNWIFPLLLAGIVFAGCASAPPNWAPKNPSPEFKRAADRLQENPPPGAEKEIPGPANAFDAGKPDFMPPAWELFGTLSNGQIAELKQKQALVLPYRQMTEKQKALFNDLLTSWQKAMSAGKSESADLRQELIKLGANGDFSNVEAAFLLRPSGRMALVLQVRQADGNPSEPLPMGIGWLRS